MNNYRTAAAEWDRLNGLRGGMLSRLERLAQLTLPYVLPPDNYDNQSQQLTNGCNSLGAQAATHLVNKLMLAMFAPSRPFMRLDMEEEAKAQLMAQLAIEEDIITDQLAVGESMAMKALEQAGQRQQLFTILSHLVVVGNVLMDLSGDEINVVGIRDYVVRRTAKGKVSCLIIRERYTFMDLDEDAKEVYLKHFPNTKDDEDIDLYTWVVLRNGKYYSSVWLKDTLLPDEFSAVYTPEAMPWRPLTWQLPVKQHYGVGRCEDYANDLAEHEGLSMSLSEGSVLASTFKWGANPAGITRPEDVTQSPNGAVISSGKEDLFLIYANIGQQLSSVMGIRADVARRIGQGFMMNSAVTRDAERVTAEEIRIQANELEASLGGTYSRLAIDIQLPLAWWLLETAEVKVKGTKIKPSVITGLDALSRNADRERMMVFLSDVAALDGIQPQTRMKLREHNIISDMAAGAGVERGRYVASREEIAQAQAQEEQRAMNQMAQGAAIDAHASQVANQEPVQ